MQFEHSNFLGAQSIVVSKRQHRPGPQRYQSQLGEDQEIVCETARKNQNAKRKEAWAPNVEE